MAGQAGAGRQQEPGVSRGMGGARPAPLLQHGSQGGGPHCAGSSSPPTSRVPIGALHSMTRHGMLRTACSAWHVQHGMALPGTALHCTACSAPHICLTCPWLLQTMPSQLHGCVWPPGRHSGCQAPAQCGSLSHSAWRSRRRMATSAGRGGGWTDVGWECSHGPRHAVERGCGLYSGWRQIAKASRAAMPLETGTGS